MIANHVTCNKRFYYEEAKLVGQPTDSDAAQGTGVAISRDGKVLVTVGPIDNGNLGGAAWVFRKRGDGWEQAQKIVPPSTIDAFLSSAAISEDGKTIFLGGPFDGFYENATSLGAVWVYRSETEDGPWFLLQKISPPDGSQASNFGTNIAVSDHVFVTGTGGTSFAFAGVLIGAAFVYRLDTCDHLWKFEQMLVSANATGFSQQGWSTAISRNEQVIAVGALGDSSNGNIDFPPGGVFIWRYDATAKIWREEALLVGLPPDGTQPIGETGSSVAISACGDLVTTGGPGFLTSTGSSWVFQVEKCHDDTCPRKWRQIAQLVGSVPNQGFSTAMTDDGAYIFISAPNSGSILVFRRVSHTQWIQESIIMPADQVGFADIGSPSSALAISKDGKEVVFGGPADNGGQGATWVYRSA